MAKKDTDLFQRLRQVGLRKQAAKTLSEAGDNAGKKAQRVARAAVAELRAIADEIERRLPAATPAPDSNTAKTPAAPRARTTTRRTTKPSAAGTKSPAAAKPGRAPRSSTPARTTRAPRKRATPPPAPSTEADAPAVNAAEAPPARGADA
jgi:hypothetical protein